MHDIEKNSRTSCHRLCTTASPFKQNRFCLRKGKAVRRLSLTDRFTSFQIQQAPSTDAYPACTTVAIFAHFWAIEARRGGGGWSAPSVASRLPSLACHQTSDVSMSSDIKVSDIEHASDLGYQASDIAYWISDIRFRTYEIRHRTSAIGQRTSDIGVWTSDVKYHAWGVFLSQSFVFSASWFKMGPSLCFGSIFKSFWTAITYVRNNLSQIIV